MKDATSEGGGIRSVGRSLGILVVTVFAGVVVAPSPAHAVTPIVLNTPPPSGVSSTTMTLSTTITDTGGSDATQSGFAYSTSSTLTTNVSTSTLGAQTGTATFTQALTSLTPATQYFFRAYATNATTTTYGPILSRTTITYAIDKTTSDKDSVLIYANKTGDARGYDLLWKDNNITGNWPEESIVAYKDGVAYIDSGTHDGYVGNRDLFAIDALTGDIISRYSIGSGYASPVIDGNTLYVGSGDESWDIDTPWTNPYGVFSFDISNIRTQGLVLNWFYADDTGKVPEAVLIDTNHVYYAQFEGTHLVALNRTDGSLAWTFSKANYSSNFNLLLGGAIYLLNSFGSNNTLYKINAADGTQLFATTTNGNSQAWDNSIAYDSDHNQIYWTANYDPSHRAVAYDMSGNIIWQHALNCASLSFTAYHDNIVYFADSCGWVYALNPADGTDVWGPVSLGGGVSGSIDISSPFVTNNLLFIGTKGNAYVTDSRGRGKFFVLNALTGATVWQYSEPDQGDVMSPASVSDGIMFNGTNYWNVYAFDVGDGTGDWLLPHGPDNTAYSATGLTSSKYVNANCSNSSATTTCTVSNLYSGRAVGVDLKMGTDTIKSVRLSDGTYHINVSGAHAYLPSIAALGSLSGLTVVSSTTYSYDTSIPRLYNVSSSTRVLEASYNATTSAVGLALANDTGSATATIASYRRPFLGATTTVASSATPSTIAASISGDTNIDSVPMDLSFSSGSINVGVSAWGASQKTWLESSSIGGTASTSHTISGLTANDYYLVKTGGVAGQNITGTTCSAGVCQATSSGSLTVTYTGTYASAVPFEVDHITVPTVAAVSASGVSDSVGTMNGDVTDTGFLTVTVEGFNYGLTSSYGSTASTSGSFSAGSYAAALTGLSCATTYHYQAYAVNSIGTSTSADQTFTTSGCPSSGGGGGGSVIPSLITTISSSTSTTTSGLIPSTLTFSTTSQPITNLSSAAIAKQTFATYMYLGSSGQVVAALQDFLRQNGFLASDQASTGYFGPITEAALKQFQAAHNIEQTGTTGPLTRAALNGGSFTQPSIADHTATSSTPTFFTYMHFASTGGDVITLQDFLRQNGFLASDQASTGYFGPITEAALKQFQAAHNIEQTGTTGPLTRAALNGSSLATGI